LADNNILVRFAPGDPSQVQAIAVTGIGGTLIGIDGRSADNQLYGLSTTNQLYRINSSTGQAQLISTLDIPLSSNEVITGFDFNPTPDRLRIVTNQRNLRINVDTGVVSTDTPVSFAPGDANAGQTPQIVAAAYTNNFAPSPAPGRPNTLYVLDANRDVLAVQGGINFPLNGTSPNLGQLTTLGSLGFDLKNAGFDITGLSNGLQLPALVAGSNFYSLDLQTGRAINLGQIGNGQYNFRGLAVQVLPNPQGGNDQIFAGDGNDLVNAAGGNDFVDAGSGNDTVLGGEGNDRLFGRDGNDILQGNDGNDELDGANGNDTLLGGAGNDTLRGGSGLNVLDGSFGNDSILGGSDVDVLDGGDGQDTLQGEGGNDNLRAGYGNDVVFGGDGSDALLGEGGNDTLYGGEGNDSIDGDAFLRFYALGANNTLLSIDPAQLGQPQSLTISGLPTGVSLKGLDRRPADNLLYGIGSDNRVYSLDFFSGAATPVSTLSAPFFNADNQTTGVGVDFNPVPDRLRLVDGSDRNFRINVNTGLVADTNPNGDGDVPLAYLAGDVNAGKDPNIVAVAYSNNLPGVTTTTLFAIDATQNTLVRVVSPNDGTLQTIGSLGIDVPDAASFDILTSGTGDTNIAMLLSGSTLYQVDLTTGQTAAVGTIGTGSQTLSGFTIALVPDPTVSADDQIFGGNGNDVLNGNLGNDTIYGEGGNDTLTGGSGNDSLFGGSGSDSFVFQSIRPFVAADLGFDTLGDFQSGVDKLVFSRVTFGSMAQVSIAANDAQAATSVGAIAYSQASGTLFFNANGSDAGFGSGAAFAKLVGTPQLTAADFVIA
jgi:Ca2+-binding RTX toxin-like protein